MNWGEEWCGSSVLGAVKRGYDGQRSRPRWAVAASWRAQTLEVRLDCELKAARSEQPAALPGGGDG